MHQSRGLGKGLHCSLYNSRNCFALGECFSLLLYSGNRLLASSGVSVGVHGRFPYLARNASISSIRPSRFSCGQAPLKFPSLFHLREFQAEILCHIFHFLPAADQAGKGLGRDIRSADHRTSEGMVRIDHDLGLRTIRIYTPSFKYFDPVTVTAAMTALGSFGSS